MELMVEEEIDLRTYTRVLLRHWRWIVGLAVVAAIVTFVYSSLQPPLYQASAVILVTQPRYDIQFDPRFKTEGDTVPARALPTLATSDTVLQSVADAYTPASEAGIQHLDFRAVQGMAQASSGSDPSLLTLKVHCRFAEDAAAIVNLWADVLVQHSDELYSNGPGDVAFFEQQVAEAQQALDSAESAVIEFQARNQSSIVQSQLDSLNRAQDEYLASQRRVAQFIQDVQALRAQLAAQPADQSASLADSLTALLLQLQAFGAEASGPIQLQVAEPGSLSDKSLAEQIAFLDDLAVTLQAKSAQTDGLLAELEPQILALQEQVEELNVEDDHLSRDRDLARDTYLTLARKLEEARIAAQEENGVLRVGSYAVVPVKPIQSRAWSNTVLVAMLGLTVGVIAAFAIEFRHQNVEPGQDKDE
jgi:uncharacterized protein involved in exopolysaccharide biosynthesis